MQKIDWSKLGGFPTCQDDIEWADKGVRDGVAQIMQALVGDGGIPVVLSGMAVSGGGNTVADGWFYYNGEITQFTGSTVTPGGGEVAIVVITLIDNNLTYNDTSVNGVVLDTQASLTHLPTVTDATHFPVTALIGLDIAMGTKYKSGWTGIAVATGGGNGTVTGTLYYMKNSLTNTVTIRANALGIGTPTDFSAAPAYTPIGIQTLPLGFRPAHSVTFSAQVIEDPLGLNRVKDDAGTDFIDTLNGGVDVSGNVILNFIKPFAGSNYAVFFKATFELD